MLFVIHHSILLCSILCTILHATYKIFYANFVSLLSAILSSMLHTPYSILHTTYSIRVHTGCCVLHTLALHTDTGQCTFHIPYLYCIHTHYLYYFCVLNALNFLLRTLYYHALSSINLSHQMKTVV